MKRFITVPATPTAPKAAEFTQRPIITASAVL